MLRNFLQGKFFQYPLHTLLVHFPMGLFGLSLALDSIAFFLQPANALVRGAFYTLAAGIGMALLAGIPGLADWATIRADHPGKKRPPFTYCLTWRRSLCIFSIFSSA